MSTTTVRPNETIDDTGVTITGGGGDLDAVLSDDSDSTYASWASGAHDSIRVGFAEPSLPAGAAWVGARTRFRAGMAGSGTRWFDITTYFDPTAGIGSGYIGPFSIFGAGVIHDVTVDAPYDPYPVTAPPTDIEAVIDPRYASGAPRLYEAYIDFVYADQPVVNPTTPSGTIDSNQPTVEWDETLDADGGPQALYEVKVFTDAVYGAGGFDPDTSSAYAESDVLEGDDLAWQVDTILPDDTYRAYVRVAQLLASITLPDGGQHWSDWDYVEFTVNVDKPGVPTMTLTPQHEYGRVMINLADTAGDAPTDYFELQRSESASGPWTDVRVTEDGMTPDAVVWDYEAGNGVPSFYRARAVDDTGTALAYSDWSSPASATWEDEPTWWLKHPTRPELNVPCRLRSQATQTRQGRKGAFQPLGRSTPIVISDARLKPEGELAVRSSNDSQRDALVAILEAQAPILVQGHGDTQMWNDRWVEAMDLVQERAVDASWGRTTFDAFPWVEVDRPDGDVAEWLDPAVSSEDVVII